MVNITLSIPTDLKHKMENFAEINWSAVAREAFDEKINDLEFIKKFKGKSSISDADALKLGREMNKRLAKRKR